MKQYKNIHIHLIKACKKGESKAQTELYLLYAKAMFNVAYRILNNVHDAEDVMQEAFIKAFSKIETYSEEQSFGAWLKKIVVNTSLDVLRKQKHYYENIDDYTDIAEEDSIVNEEDIVFEAVKVRNAIMKLPSGYRIVLSLYLLEGYDHNEISNILGITASGSRAQLTRAKRKLLDILRDQ